MSKQNYLVLLMIGWVALSCGRENEMSDSESRSGANPGRTEQAPKPQTAQVVVPAGTVFTVALDQSLSSKTNSAGDRVQAHVVNEIRSEGEVVVANGAAVSGVVSEVDDSDRVKGRAFVALDFRSLETVAGPRNVKTTMVDGSLEAPGSKKRDAAIIIGGAAAGAVIGEVLGDNPKLGAIIGGAAGTGVVLATKGSELEVEPGTQFSLKLVEPLEVTITKAVAAAP